MEITCPLTIEIIIILFQKERFPIFESVLLDCKGRSHVLKYLVLRFREHVSRFRIILLHSICWLTNPRIIIVKERFSNPRMLSTSFRKDNNIVSEKHYFIPKANVPSYRKLITSFHKNCEKRWAGLGLASQAQAGLGWAAWPGQGLDRTD